MLLYANSNVKPDAKRSTTVCTGHVKLLFIKRIAIKSRVPKVCRRDKTATSCGPSSSLPEANAGLNLKRRPFSITHSRARLQQQLDKSERLQHHAVSSRSHLQGSQVHGLFAQSRSGPFKSGWDRHWTRTTRPDTKNPLDPSTNFSEFLAVSIIHYGRVCFIHLSSSRIDTFRLVWPIDGDESKHRFRRRHFIA